MLNWNLLPPKVVVELNSDSETFILFEFFQKTAGICEDFEFSKYPVYMSIHLPFNSKNDIEVDIAPELEIKRFHEANEFIHWYHNDYLFIKNLVIIKHIPHSSLAMPKIYDEEIISNVYGPYFDIYNYKMTDLFVDKLFESIDGIEIKARYSRLYCDVERYKDNSKEPMAKLGQGYLYTKSSDGYGFHRHILKDNIDVDKDVDSYYGGHHQQLFEITDYYLSKGKNVLIIDLHSFSNEQARYLGKSEPFPDICVGFNDGTDERIIRAITEMIKRNGYSVSLNYPYSGSIMPNKVRDYNLEGGKLDSIMIEVNKRIYL